MRESKNGCYTAHARGPLNLLVVATGLDRSCDATSTALFKFLYNNNTNYSQLTCETIFFYFLWELYFINYIIFPLGFINLILGFLMMFSKSYSCGKHIQCAEACQFEFFGTKRFYNFFSHIIDRLIILGTRILSGTVCKNW